MAWGEGLEASVSEALVQAARATKVIIRLRVSPNHQGAPMEPKAPQSRKKQTPLGRDLSRPWKTKIAIIKIRPISILFFHRALHAGRMAEFRKFHSIMLTYGMGQKLSLVHLISISLSAATSHS